MSTRNIVLALCLSVLGIGGNVSAQKQENIAVLELFTSEGCSSCPPADVLLGSYATGKPNVFALSFHVDYWNALGWKDPFSQKEFTLRQKAYAAALNIKGIYTPQLVVNGRSEFVGSNKKKLRSALANAVKTDRKLTLVSAIKNRQKIALLYHCSAKGGDVLHVALVLKKVSTQVRRGENSGRTLIHYNVVTQFLTVPPKPDGSISIAVPDNFQKENYRIIAYLQQGEVGKIETAAQIEIH